MRFILLCLLFLSEADNRKLATFQTCFMSYEDFCYVNLPRNILWGKKHKSGISYVCGSNSFGIWVAGVKKQGLSCWSVLEWK